MSSASRHAQHMGLLDKCVGAGSCPHESGSRALACLRDAHGQSSVEAAFALPILMVLVLLLLQPGIVLYDRIVMSGAAAEGCRLLATSSDGASTSEDFIRRRLGAIPELDQFHMHSGGCSWQIELSGNESSDVVSVKLRNELKPLPLLDAGMTMLGLTDVSGCLPLEVESTQQVQPDWIDSASEGRDPERWPGI